MAFATVKDGIDRLKRLYNRNIGEISDQLYFDWFNDLNYMVYEMLYNINAEEYLAEDTISVISGTSLYSLPNDFLTLNTQCIGDNIGIGFFPIDDTTQSRIPLKYTGFASNDKGYYLKGKTAVVFTPEPTVDQDITLRYIPEISEITSQADELVINKRYLASIINWLDKNYGQWSPDVFRENAGDQRFVRSLTQILNAESPDAQIFDMT